MARSFNSLMAKRETLANSAARATVDVRMAFLKRVYKLVGLTALAAFAGAIIPFYASPKYHLTLGIIGIAGYFIPMLIFWFGTDIRRKPLPASILLSIFGFATGILVVPLVMFALTHFEVAQGAKIIGLAGGLTLLTFISLSGYVMVTRRDFSFLGGALTMLCIGLIVAVIAGIFIHAPMLHILISIGFVIIASMFILYDTSMILKYYPLDEPYYAAFHLYWDVWILFYYLLRILLIIAASRD